MSLMINACSHGLPLRSVGELPVSLTAERGTATTSNFSSVSALNSLCTLLSKHASVASDPYLNLHEPIRKNHATLMKASYSIMLNSSWRSMLSTCSSAGSSGGWSLFPLCSCQNSFSIPSEVSRSLGGNISASNINLY